MKRIFFIPELVEKLRSEDPPKVTYRTRRKQGMYSVVTGSWYKARHEGVAILIDRSEPVDPRCLTDEKARLAGVESLEMLLALFEKWYGKVPEIMYRNWIADVYQGCKRCGSWRVFPHFGITEYAFSECADCGAVYNGAGDLTHAPTQSVRR